MREIRETRPVGGEHRSVHAVDESTRFKEFSTRTVGHVDGKTRAVPGTFSDVVTAPEVLVGCHVDGVRTINKGNGQPCGGKVVAGTACFAH